MKSLMILGFTFSSLAFGDPAIRIELQSSKETSAPPGPSAPLTVPLRDANGVISVLRDVFGTGAVPIGGGGNQNPMGNGNSPLPPSGQQVFRYQHTTAVEAPHFDYLFEDWGGVCDPNNPQNRPNPIGGAVGFNPSPSIGNGMGDPLITRPRSCLNDESRSLGSVQGKAQLTRMARMIRACQMLTLPSGVPGPVPVQDENWKVIKTAIDRMNVTPQNPQLPDPLLYQYNDPIGQPTALDIKKAYAMFYPGAVASNSVVNAIQSVVNKSNTLSYATSQDQNWYAWRSVFLVLCMTPTWQVR